ncbi:uncharacterized protein KZ484_015020 [Pholidichthys leucotaenia]
MEEQEKPEFLQIKEEPEPPQIKEEREELFISQEGEQLVVKVEAKSFTVTLISEKNQQSEAKPNSEQLFFHNSAGAEIQDEEGSRHLDSGSTKEKEEPKPKKRQLKTSHSNSDDDSLTSKTLCGNETDATQLHYYKEEEVLTVQQLWNQERNSSLDQEEQDAVHVKEEEEEQLCFSQEEEHFGLKQETVFFMVTPTDEDSDDTETESNSEQLLSHNSSDTESQDQGAGENVNLGSSKHEEPNPKKRVHRKISDGSNVDSSSISENRCDTDTGKKSVKCSDNGEDLINGSDKNKHHTVDKPHVCSMCGKKFRRRSSLSVHERTHTDFPQQPDCKDKEILVEQLLWNQERNSVMDQEEPQPPQMKEEQEESDPPKVKEEQELEHPQMKVEQEEPEPPQVKEEQEEFFISQEGKQLVVKLEASTFVVTLISEETQRSEAEPNGEQLFFHNSAVTDIQDEEGSWHVDLGSTKEGEEPKPKNRQLKTRINGDDDSLTSKTLCENETDALQLHYCKKEQVLTVQQLWNQERNSSIDQEEQDAAQIKEEELSTSQEEEHFGLKQETDFFMVTPGDEDNDSSEKVKDFKNESCKKKHHTVDKPHTDINAQWNHLKRAVIESAEETSKETLDHRCYDKKNG